MSNENRLLTSVHTVARLLSSTINPDEALRFTLEAALESVDATSGTIYLHDPASHKLWFRHVMGTDSEGNALSAGFGLYGETIGDDEGIAGQVFQSRTPQVTNDAQQNPQHAKRIDDDFQFETINMATVPIQFPDSLPIGVLQVINKRDGDFTEDDLDVLDLIVSVSAMSVQTAALAKETSKSTALDYLGGVVRDMQEKSDRLSGRIDSLEEAVSQLSEAIPVSELETPKALVRDALASVAEGVKDLRRYTELIVAAVEPKQVDLNVQ